MRHGYLMLCSFCVIGAVTLGCEGGAVEDEGTARAPGRVLAVESVGAEGVMGGSMRHGRATYDVTLPTTGSPAGVLTLHLFQDPNAPDTHIDIVARQALGVRPLGTRYLEEDAFDGFEVSLRRPGDTRSHVGEVVDLDLHFDTLTGVFYADLRLGFDGIEPSGDGVSLEVGVEGFSTVYCLVDDRRVTQLDVYYERDEPEACAEVFDVIRATPDDPDAPAAPYALYPDDTPDGVSVSE